LTVEKTTAFKKEAVMSNVKKMLRGYFNNHPMFLEKRNYWTILTKEEEKEFSASFLELEVVLTSFLRRKSFESSFRSDLGGLTLIPVRDKNLPFAEYRWIFVGAEGEFLRGGKNQWFRRTFMSRIAYWMKEFCDFFPGFDLEWEIKTMTKNQWEILAPRKSYGIDCSRERDPWEFNQESYYSGGLAGIDF